MTTILSLFSIPFCRCCSILCVFVLVVCLWIMIVQKSETSPGVVRSSLTLSHSVNWPLAKFYPVFRCDSPMYKLQRLNWPKYDDNISPLTPSPPKKRGKSMPFEGPPLTIKQIFNMFCFIFIQTWGVSAAWWSGYTNKNTFVERFHQIQILNIFVPHNLTEYEYRIYLFLPTLPNTNIEYIRS